MLDLSDDHVLKRLFRNPKAGIRLLAVEEPNGDVIYAELDENDDTLNAGNRFIIVFQEASYGNWYGSGVRL